MKDKANNSLKTPRAPMNRREGLKLGTASLMTSLLPISSSVAAQTESPPKEKAMADNTTIRPFHFEASQADLADLRRRVSATKWPDREQVSDAAQGVQLATTQKLAQYWATQHDWRKCEAKINGVPNFITEINGLDIHFIHVRSKHENALPMIVAHGWPGSFIEQMKIIEPLTNPTAHGGTAADAFDLVIPSLPGYGFSGKPTAPGWNPVSIAKAWATLMQRLGYTRYGRRVATGAMPSRRTWLYSSRLDCLAFTPTWRPPFHPTCRRRSRSEARRRPASRLMKNARGISSTTSSRTGWVTPSR